MEYELKVLEHIIAYELNPARITRNTLNNKYLTECRLRASNEKERIRKQFREVAFGKHQNSDLESYFRRHQAILVDFADMVYSYLQPGGPDSIYRLTNEVSILNFYKEISMIPGELVDFIEKNFPEYFDHDLKVPESKRWVLMPGIKRNLRGIQKGLEKLEVDGEFIEIACYPMEKCLLPDEVISYHELGYIQELQQELNSLISKKDKADVDEELCRLLLQLNFNSIRFFNYYILKLQEKAKELTSFTELFKYHSLKLKIINQLRAKEGWEYKPGLPPIREQIGSWICEELYYLEKQEQLKSCAVLQKKEGPASETKVHTSLSVAHLALAVKLLVDSKVITNTNSAELMRVVARNFRTDKQEAISEDSLRNKSYNFESSTVNRLKDEIISLMNLVRKY